MIIGLLCGFHYFCVEYSPRFWTAFWESFDSPKLWIFESELFSHGFFESTFIWNFPKRQNNLIFSYFIRNEFLEKPMTENTIFWKNWTFLENSKNKIIQEGGRLRWWHAAAEPHHEGAVGVCEIAAAQRFCMGRPRPEAVDGGLVSRSSRVVCGLHLAGSAEGP